MPGSTETVYKGRNPVFALEMIQTVPGEPVPIPGTEKCRNPVFALEMIQT